MGTTKKVTVFGSFVVDLMARTPRLPVPGETVKGTYFKQGAGGKGFNQGIAAHKSGGNVVMVTKLGRDSLAQVAERAMDEVHLSRENLFYHEEVGTGTALIMVDETTSQNEIIVVPGACGTITREDILSVEKEILKSQYLLLQLEVNQDANEYVAKFAKENGVKVIINTAPYQPMTDGFLNGAYLVTPNETEAEAMTGIKVTDQESADQAAKVMLAKGVQNVLITLGSKGVYIYSEGKSVIIPAYKVEAVDTTGAGDAFNGGLLTALSEGKTLMEAAKFANAVAALSVQKIGTTPSMPSREHVDAFIQANR